MADGQLGEQVATGMLSVYYLSWALASCPFSA